MPVPAFHNEIEMSSPRRRSIVPQFASTPYIANDDEVERIKRRTNSELQKRVSNLGVANRSVATSDGEGGELNESKLQDHYQTCVKLFTENKINAKNAWNVHIVEYMQAMLKKGLVMKDTLKLASTSIDIGCKVYCLKVDQVHSDLFKLASAMARVNMEDNRENDDDEAAEAVADEAVDGNQKKKEKKKKRLRKSLDNQDCEITVATNENTLNGNITPHNTAIQQVSSGKNRLYTLSTITKQKWGYEQMVNSRSKFPYYTSLGNDTENVKISDQKVPVTVPPAKAQICPSFTDFVINRWQPDDDDVPLGTQPLSNLTQNIVYDDNGLPIPELDASVHDPDDHDNVFEDAEEIVETGVGHAEIRRPVAFITEMRPGQGPLSDVPLQYSYRSAPVVSDRYLLSGVWAGPSHWKIKSLQRRTVNIEGENANTAPVRNRRPRKSEPDIIRYDVESDVEDEDLILVNNNKKTKRVRRGSQSKVTLPEDLNITREDLCSLKQRPHVLINIESSAEANTAETSRVNLNMTANYQYDNPDDADYCSQTLNDHGDADVDDHNDSNNDANNDVFQQTLTDENMVNMPSQVQKFQVPYATQAKRMDMRKLKDAIWKSMAVTETGDEHILENDEELHNIKLNQVKFSDMYKVLPSHLTNRMTEELSSPLAFVALLHLANEETLKLKDTSELNDIIISTNK